MADTFKTGDVVQLKSGGPSMTVKRVHGSGTFTGMVECEWFAGSEVKTSRFLPDMLQIVGGSAGSTSGG